MKKIVLFDGDCHFCNKSVQFILKRDPKAFFQFASLQSEIGQELIHQYKIPQHIDSLVLIDSNRYYIKSTAALRICLNLKGLWKTCFILTIVPKWIRDRFYDYIAKNRYKWFGTNSTCKIPTDEERERFL